MTADGRIRAAIFDMDGVLVDSEPFWRRAEIELFGARGVPLTEELCATTMGWCAEPPVVVHLLCESDAPRWGEGGPRHGEAAAAYA